MGPLSEIYGRSRVVQLGNLFFLGKTFLHDWRNRPSPSSLSAWNLACGFAQNQTQLIIFRFLAGIGGCAPITVLVLFHHLNISYEAVCIDWGCCCWRHISGWRARTCYCYIFSWSYAGSCNRSVPQFQLLWIFNSIIIVGPVIGAWWALKHLLGCFWSWRCPNQDYGTNELEMGGKSALTT